MKSKLFQRIASLLLIPLFFILCNFCGDLLMPLRTEYGCNWEGYQAEDPDTIDMLFFGSSLAYCDVIPGIIYQDTGITSYVMAGPVMTIPVTYYYVREACKTQSPQMIALEVNGMFFSEYTDYTKSTVGYMPWSWNRIAAIFQGAEPESRFGLLFPLYNYHGRIASAPLLDVLGHLSPQTDLYAGYMCLSENTPQEETVERDYTADTDAYRKSLRYLTKISEFCEKNGIQLLLYAAPAKSQIPAAVKEQLLQDIGELKYTAFLDFNSNVDEISIDDGLDWFDSLHLNTNGALKFSRYLATVLADRQWVTPSGTADSSLWESRVAAIADYTASAAGG